MKNFYFITPRYIITDRGPGSVVGTAIGYGINGPGIESRWRTRFSAPVQTGPGAYPASCTTGFETFPGVKRQGRGVDQPPHLEARLKKEYSYTSTPSGPSWPVLGRILPLPLPYDFIMHSNFTSHSVYTVILSHVFLCSVVI